ncbi:MAG: hypothetical protein Q9197_000989 [Variospora fuerteventurae]
MRTRRTVARQPAKKAGTLEQKLDGLVALLKTSASGRPEYSDTPLVNPATNYNATVLTPHSSAAGATRYEGFNSSQHIRTGTGLLDTPTATSSSGSTSTTLPYLVQPALEPSLEDAETYLRRFRTDFIKYLPFIVIVPSVSAQQLRQTSPFLWLCIMTVASTRSSQQVTLSREVRQLFGREAYLGGTRSMDLLLACLVYATWDHRYNLDRPILTSLAQLAIAILYDLGLDKPSLADPGLMLEYDLKGLPRPSQRPEQKEFASDELLVPLLRSRLLVEKIGGVPWSGVTEGDHLTKPLAMSYLKSLQAQLRALKSCKLSEPTDQKTLLLQLHITDLAIHEIGFSQGQDLFTGQSNHRFECLCACLQAIKDWVDVFLSIPPAQYVGFSACIYAMMGRCLIDLWRLSTCEHPEWDHSLVRESLDVWSVFEQTERNFSRVKEAAGLDLGGSHDCDFFTIMASRLRSMKVSWNAVNASTELATPVLDELGDFSMELFDTWNW